MASSPDELATLSKRPNRTGPSIVTEHQPQTDRVYNVTFLCTGNSARSIIAECILNRVGDGRFVASSAGSTPAGRVNPYALELLASRGFPTSELRSKSWDELTGPSAPQIDFVFTLCDSAAAETCPVWAGDPRRTHWSPPDPAAVEGPQAIKRAAFAEVFAMLANRIRALVSLPIDSLDEHTLQRQLKQIGEGTEAG